jgi:dienelactone hydrolase
MDKIEIDHAGAHLVGDYAVPAGTGPFPVVLVMSNAHGLGPQARASARLLAAAGYLAVCTDMYGGGAFHANPANAGDDYLAVMTDRKLLRSRTNAWLEAASALPQADRTRRAAIGYCFGGCCVLELARSGAEVKAVVSYHGILETPLPAEPGAVKALVAVYAGAGDPYAPPATTRALAEEMAAAGAACHITEFGDAMHSFTDPDAHGDIPGIAYNRLAHLVSWAGTLALLNEVLG